MGPLIQRMKPEELVVCLQRINCARHQGDPGSQLRDLQAALELLPHQQEQAPIRTELAQLPPPAAAARLLNYWEAWFDYPQRRLAVYGTLAPGEKNHRVVAQLRGSSWTRAVIRGRRFTGPGYPFFHWEPNGPALVAQILESEDLPAHWPRIDDFEGAEYRRIWVTAHTATQLVVANLYEAIVSED